MLGKILNILVRGNHADSNKLTPEDGARNTPEDTALSIFGHGERSVTANDLSGANVITGDNNTIGNIDAAGLRELSKIQNPSRLRQLPLDVPDFQGRSAEEAELLATLAGESGAVSLTAINGMGGIGKTALAVRLAHKLKGRYRDAQLFIDLKGVSEPVTPEAALERLIHSFEPQAQLPENLEALQTIYRTLLSNCRTVVVLDNARDGEQVKPLLPPAPSIAIVTSRRSFALPGLVPKTLGKLDLQSSRALLRGLLPDNRRASDVELDALAKRCGYLPLALRAAGSFLAANSDWKISDYLQDLADTRQRLKGPDDQNLDVLMVLGFSAAQLRKDNTSLANRWCLLQVFPTDFDRAAVKMIWKAEDGETRDQLSQLIRWSMLEYDAENQRYRLHDLMRDVAANEAKTHKLDGAVGHAKVGHSIHYWDVLKQANALYMRGHDHVAEGLALYDRESVNITNGQALASTLLDAVKPLSSLSSSYANAGAHVLHLRLHPRTFVAWLEAAIVASRRAEDRQGENTHLGNLGIAYFKLGEITNAIESYELALAIARDIGDRRGEGSDLGNLGTAYAALGETLKAFEHYELALTIAREVGDRHGEGNFHSNLGIAYAKLGDVRKAIEQFKLSLTIARDVGDRLGEGNRLGNLGNAYANLGEMQKAIEHYQLALENARDIGNRRGVGAHLSNIGLAYANLGEFQKATSHFKQALPIARDIGDRQIQGDILGNLGNIYSLLGEIPMAIDFYEQALVTFEAIGSPQAETTRTKLAALKTPMGESI